MKIIETLWFNGFKGSVGIVVAEEEITKTRVAYIGVASGEVEKTDIDSIISFGLPFTIDTAKRIIHQLGEKT